MLHSKKLKTIIGAALIASSTMAFTTTANAQSNDNRYIGEMLITGANFCPKNWIRAEGQLLSIQQNTTLFSLYGTNYGGDGRTTFAVPDLRGKTPIGAGNITKPVFVPNVGLKYKTVGDYKIGYTSETKKDTLGTEEIKVKIDNSDQGKTILVHTEILKEAVQTPYITLKWCINTTGLYPSRN